MGKKPTRDTTTVPEPTPNGSDTFVLLISMADTTWRMFAPTLPLIVLGNWLDSMYGTKPWLMLAGAVVGGAIAALLIRAQLRRKL